MNTRNYMQQFKSALYFSRPFFRLFSFFVFILFLSVSEAKAQIHFEYFREEIDKLRKDRKVTRYWQELYRDDRDNVRLKVPMDSMFLLNRLKAAYLIQKYGFPTPQRFGKNANRVFLSIVTNNCFSDLNTLTFPQVLPGDSLRLWGARYPNALMVNQLFWYNGIEIALDQEFALALKRLENRSMDTVDMDQLCTKASELLKFLHSGDKRSIGKWTMNYREMEIPLEIWRLKEKYYLKKGKYFFELKQKEPFVFVFAEDLDGTNLFIFENGELVLRDMYDREMGIFPVSSPKK